MRWTATPRITIGGLIAGCLVTGGLIAGCSSAERREPAPPPVDPTPAQAPTPAPNVDGPRPSCSLTANRSGDDITLEFSVTNTGSTALELSYFEPFADFVLTADIDDVSVRIDQPAWNHPVRPATLSIPPNERVTVTTPITLRFDASDAAPDASVPSRWVLRHEAADLRLIANLRFGEVAIGPCQADLRPAAELPYQSVELVVRAIVLRSDTATAGCGIFHFAAAREYRVLEVLEGQFEGERLYALQSCPLMAPALLPAPSVYRLELSEEQPSGLSIIDTLGDPEQRRLYIVRATPETPTLTL